jgi:hypothetical protein
MAAMKFSAVRKPNERWRIDLVLLFILSAARWKGATFSRPGFRPDGPVAGARIAGTLPGADDRRIATDQCRKDLFLIRRQVSRVLEQQPTAALAGALLFGVELPRRGVSHPPSQPEPSCLRAVHYFFVQYRHAPAGLGGKVLEFP